MANPSTCRHNIITPGFNNVTYESFLACCSCDTILKPEQLKGRQYEYDIDNNVWVRKANHG